MSRHQTFVTIVIAIALTLTVGVADAGFADPLDTPAVASALAPRGLINGIAQAGQRIVAVGQRGHIVYSDNGGTSWTQAKVPVRSDLTAVCFPTARSGWAVGQDGVVLASHDGGATWSKQLDGRAIGPLLVRWYTEHVPKGMDAKALARLRADAQRFKTEGPDQPLLDVWFENDRHGFVVGAFNLILETHDGGASWIPWLDRTDNPRALHLYAIRALGKNLWIAGEQGLLMELDRSAQRFRAVTLPYHGTLFGLADDAGVIMTYGLRGNAYLSRDGGVTWSKAETDTEANLTAATHAADGTLVLVSQTGQVLISKNHGASFTTAKPDRRVPASSVLPLPGGALLLGGPAGLQRVSLEHLP
jgi:photosystem II stability/assembly factor-like uncharacterized protein